MFATEAIKPSRANFGASRKWWSIRLIIHVYRTPFYLRAFRVFQPPPKSFACGIPYMYMYRRKTSARAPATTPAKLLACDGRQLYSRHCSHAHVHHIPNPPRHAILPWRYYYVSLAFSGRYTTAFTRWHGFG